MYGIYNDTYTVLRGYIIIKIEIITNNKHVIYTLKSI